MIESKIQLLKSGSHLARSWLFNWYNFGFSRKAARLRFRFGFCLWFNILRFLSSRNRVMNGLLVDVTGRHVLGFWLIIGTRRNKGLLTISHFEMLKLVVIANILEILSAVPHTSVTMIYLLVCIHSFDMLVSNNE